MRSKSRRSFFGQFFSALVFSLGLSGTLMGSNMAYAQDERQLETAFGTVTLSGQPERVVVLDEGALDTALSVGIQPIAALASRGGKDVADYLQEYLTEPIDIVGTVREPNIEAIFRLKPDLILASSETNDALYGKLSRIAPTIVPDRENTFTDWKTTVRLFAEALDKKDEVEAKLAELDEQLETMHSYWEKPQTVSVVRWNPQGPVLMSGKLFTGQLIRAAGLETLPLADDLGNRPHSDTLSLENLVQIDADWLLLASLTADGEAALIEAQKQPAFQRLSAVEKDQVKVVDGQVWSSGYGPLAAQVIIEDLSQLVKE